MTDTLKDELMYQVKHTFIHPEGVHVLECHVRGNTATLSGYLNYPRNKFTITLGNLKASGVNAKFITDF